MPSSLQPPHGAITIWGLGEGRLAHLYQFSQTYFSITQGRAMSILECSFTTSPNAGMFVKGPGNSMPDHTLPCSFPAPSPQPSVT